ncbi:hypothetical protein [Asticcacaulis endophyticus]|nr:hypothetical protein [Asticcacaulis endophyticus]
MGFLNGGFFSALFGAFAGAWGAHKIAQSAKSRELILDEIRSVNVAITLVADICNAYIVLKKQMTIPMIGNYNEIKSRFEKHNPAIDGVFSFTADYETFKAPLTSTEQLKNFTIENITVNGRLLSAIFRLDSTSFHLKEMIEHRNKLISDIYEMREKIDPIKSLEFFLGIKNELGTNKIYPDTLESIERYTDDVIFFSKIACEDLIQHGTMLTNKYKKKHKTNPPKLNILAFDKAEAMGLLPPIENYQEWLQGFKDQKELKQKSKKLVLRWPITFTEKPEPNQ